MASLFASKRVTHLVLSATRGAAPVGRALTVVDCGSCERLHVPVGPIVLRRETMELMDALFFLRAMSRKRGCQSVSDKSSIVILAALVEKTCPQIGARADSALDA